MTRIIGERDYSVGIYVIDEEYVPLIYERRPVLLLAANVVLSK